MSGGQIVDGFQAFGPLQYLVLALACVRFLYFVRKQGCILVRREPIEERPQASQIRLWIHPDDRSALDAPSSIAAIIFSQYRDVFLKPRIS